MATTLPTEGLEPVERSDTPLAQRRHRAEVSDALLDAQGHMIDWLVGFTLGTLDGQHVEIRVLPAQPNRLVIATLEHAGLLPQ